MISFVFLGIVAIVYIIAYFITRFSKNAITANSILNWIFLGASYIFVLLIDFRFLLILIGLSLSTWLFGKQKKFYIAGIIIAIATLAFFKYFNFFISSFADIFHINTGSLNIILPIGLSFYTFSAIGYLIDVHRQKIESKSLKDVALYLAFFPKLISGPLIKSTSFFEQAEKPREIGCKTFLPGIQIFVFGLFKKIVLADTIAVFVNQVFGAPNAFSGGTILLAVLAYTLQIYFDFSGYSDMAIGVAKIYGFDFPKNFNLPYLSHNVTEFWKRWHITLSEWLQEYLYIPLGGNKKGKFRTYLNLVIVMVVGGLWHGANWTFVVWGLFHGLALVFHKLWMKATKSNIKNHKEVFNVLSILLTYLFVSFCWIFFRASSIQDAFNIILRIATFKGGINHPHLWTILIASGFLLIIGIIIFISYKRKTFLETNKTNICRIVAKYPVLDLTKFWNLVIFFSFCAIILCLAFTGGSPFIYGNF